MVRKVKESGRVEPFSITILGEAASKANSRRVIFMKGRVRVIKSQKAIGFAQATALQCPVLNPMFLGDVHVEARIYYASRRPDLDESIVLDAIQGRVYANDRQVKSKYVVHGIDKERPRVELRVRPLSDLESSGVAGDQGRVGD